MGAARRVVPALALVAALAGSARPGEEPVPSPEANARAVLEKAADKQGGASLCPPAGKLESFKITFGKVKVPKAVKAADGSTTRLTSELDDKGVVLVWRGDEIRTSWTIDGKTTQRGRALNKGVMTAWLNDGVSPTKRLTRDENPKDIEEIDRDQRIVRAVADVALLRRALGDGSRWAVVEKPGAPVHPGVALERAAADGRPALTVWIDATTAQLHAARTRSAGAELDFQFGYRADFPAVSGAALAFPFSVTVTERSESGGAHELVLEGKVAEVSFNTVMDADLRPATAPVTPPGGTAVPAPGK